MTQFAATFSNGQTITRNSDHAYAFAWAVIQTSDGKIEYKGFSADRANAAKAAQAQVWTGPSARDRKNPGIRRHWAKMAKEQGFASVDALIAHWEAEAAETNAARHIEIVAVA
jgi:hypothetical protein